VVQAGSNTEIGSHPDFSDPPVVETVLGVEFTPLEGWRIPHFGLFWQTIRGDFPRIEDQLPLESQIERFDAPRREALTVEFMNKPLARCWFLSESGNVLLQLQKDRFIQNWRKITGSEDYPRYGTTRERFERDWKRFAAFLESNGLDSPKIQQCEVTYLNHIEPGKGWRSLSDLTGVFSFLGRFPGGELPEAFTFRIRYVLPNKRGRLHLRVDPAIRNRDGKEIILFSLIARGAPYSSSTEDVLEWFDFGREWIHKAFAELTAPSARISWGGQEAE
jgi:uncharacterized protein (TIGR04255 family)